MTRWKHSYTNSGQTVWMVLYELWIATHTHTDTYRVVSVACLCDWSTLSILGCTAHHHIVRYLELNLSLSPSHTPRSHCVLCTAYVKSTLFLCLVQWPIVIHISSIIFMTIVIIDVFVVLYFIPTHQHRQSERTVGQTDIHTFFGESSVSECEMGRMRKRERDNLRASSE